MSTRKIIEAFESWRGRGEPLVLATVFDTAGSTYTKAGHRMLIAANGDYQGLVSGGCLEGDLAEHASRVAETGSCAAVTYDMRDETDDLFGLGIGCNGLIRVFLQPLTARDDYSPFRQMAEAGLSRDSITVATVIESNTQDPPPGTTVAFGLGGPAVLWGRVRDVEGFARSMGADRPRAPAGLLRDSSGALVLVAPVRRVPRLLILGAGLDAVPIVRIAAELGWIVTVADHRPAYVEREGFELADARLLVEPRDLRETVEPAQLDAVLVMSHHLATDEQYLRALAWTEVPYLGVLGPPARRERLLDALGPEGEALRARLRGPVGLDIGADSPEAIALSFVAELQAVTSGRA